MSGLFDRLSLHRLTPEDKAVGVAVGAVLASAVGLSVVNPLAGGRAVAETSAQTAAVAEQGTAAHDSSQVKTVKAENVAAEARREGFKVPRTPSSPPK
ncbi:hypothetical protein ACFQY7_16065 [Actinomadura luteofluorescens]|uniref:hypothetical protein n=1 Tax=Actinomadura luteofluorescens TaxID=46163 RepID=UPI00363607DE